MTISKINTNSIAAGASPTMDDLTLSGSLFLGGTGSANEMSDYEEGTWTPEFLFGTSITYNSQSGSYVKVGSIVYATFDLDVATLSSDASEVTIDLPFTFPSGVGQVLFTIDGSSSTLVSAGNSVVSARSASVDRVILSQFDGSRLDYNDFESSGLFKGAVMFTTTG